jgi:hypothetical protein
MKNREFADKVSGINSVWFGKKTLSGNFRKNLKGK